MIGLLRVLTKAGSHLIQTKWKTIILTSLMGVMLSGCLFTDGDDEFSFIVISDVHVPTYMYSIGQPLDEDTMMQMHNQKRLQQFTEECLAMESKPDFVMNCGDTGDVGWINLLTLYQKLMQPLVSAGIPVYTVVGNHDLDYAGIGRQDLAEIFDPLGPEKIGRKGTRYSFEYGGCHFIVMNNRPISGLIRFNPMDIDWLRSDLKTVKKDTRILLFMHANMREDDTHRIVELLQPFTNPVIFHGHRHSASIDTWGGIPVVLTGSLYGGTPEAGSYRVVNVTPDKIVVRTRDYAKPAGTLEPEEVVEFPQPGPQLHVIEPENEAFVSENMTLVVTAEPAQHGTLEYSIPGVIKWTSMLGEMGRWEETVPAPVEPGRHFLAFRYKGDNGSTILAHRVIKIPGKNVSEVWSIDIGSAIQGAPVICGDLVIVPTAEGGVYALRLDDGKEVWHREYEGQVLGRMVTDGDLVYYSAGRTVIACDAKTGKLKWETPLNGTMIAGMTTGNGKLFIPAGERKLFCLDALSGEILWDYSTSLPIIMEPETDGINVYFGAMDGYFRALDIMTGKETWSNQWSSMEDKYTTAPFWPPVISGDNVIVCKSPARKEEKNLVSFSASTGKVLWSRRLSAGRLRLAMSPDKVEFYTSYNRDRQQGIQCLAAKDGSSLWSTVTGVGMNAGCAGGDFVLARDGESICCVHSKSGTVQWTYKTSIGPQGSLYGPGAFAVKDNMVVVGNMDGRVLSLKW
ncbi:PQQ-binding-like beta-propeller repeat protein [Candidatus Omnitrophota bacterium]